MRWTSHGLRNLLAVLLLGTFACAGNGPQRPAQTVTRNTHGLTIVQDVRVSAAVRSDFDEALRHVEQQDYDRGIVLLREVTQRAPWITAAHIDLAIAYRLNGDVEAAEESLLRALELSPEHPAAHNELGIVLRKTGRFAEARERYETALEIYPHFHFARLNLAILCDLYLSDARCALEHYRLYLEAVPHDESAAMWVADLQNRVEP